MKPGSYTLATYEGQTVTLKANVKQVRSQIYRTSDWFKCHWASIEETETFEGVYAFSTSYNQIKGSKGTISLANSDGMFHGSLIKGMLYYSTVTIKHPKSNQIGLVFSRFLLCLSISYNKVKFCIRLKK